MSKYVNDFSNTASKELMCWTCLVKSALQVASLEYLGMFTGTSRSDPTTFVKPFAALVAVNIVFDFLSMEYKGGSAV